MVLIIKSERNKWEILKEFDIIKAPRIDLITWKVLEGLSSKKCLKLIAFNAIIHYFPNLWKVAHVVIILKPSNNLHIYILETNKFIADLIEDIIKNLNIKVQANTGRKKYNTGA